MRYVYLRAFSEWGAMIYEHLQLSQYEQYGTRTSNYIPYSSVMIDEHLTTFPIGAL